MTTIRIEGVDELIKRVDDISKLHRTKQAIKAGGESFERYMKEYPTHVSRPNPLIKLDPRVRRGFFWHLKNDPDFKVPYRRTTKLQDSWNTKVENKGFRAVVGTNVSYARLVQDSAKQSSYHRHTGWITTRQAEMLYGSQIIDQIKQALISEVENG